MAGRTVSPAGRASMLRVASVLAPLLPACFAGYSLHESAVRHNDQGITRLAEGDLEGAAAAFRLALEYNNRFSEPYNNLALVEIRRGNLDEAEELLRRALLLCEDFAEAWTNLGYVRLRRGDAAEAVAAFEESIAIDPGQLDARYDLILALSELGDLDEAWEQVLRLDVATPDDPAAQGLAAWIASRLLRHDEALGWATRALAANPAEPLANLAAGVALLERGAADEAETFLRAAQASDLGPAASMSLGLALLRLARWAESRAAFAAALEVSPDLLPALVGAGTAAAGEGDLAAAHAALSRALELDAASGGLDPATRTAAEELLASLGE
ncbi:MAG: tetratricopeptide repeat protein [Deltaproteobacteria bacterium]|nr:tetratricopeptide repeat protein [Deltaproteobacteria bacterium]